MPRKTKISPRWPVIPEGERFAGGHTNPWHSHDRACLVYPAEGVVTVETEEGQWVVPSRRAVWLPAGVEHQTKMSGPVTLQSLLVDQAAVPGLPESACVVGITALLRELILHATAAALRLKSNESGAGRFTDFYLPPLTFAEFLKFLDLDAELISELPTGPTLRFQTSDVNRLNEAFIDYLNYGGYPEAVLSSEIQKKCQTLSWPRYRRQNPTSRPTKPLRHS